VLLDNSASPLLHALETTDLGRAPSSLCGHEDSFREMSFLCGLEGCAADSTAAIEKLILDTLERVAREGVPQDMVEAALHTLELHQREISGDSYPYGLQLILSALSTATHRGDPIELLDIDPVLEQLKLAIQDRNFIPALIREYLLDNPHRLTLTVHPDTTLSDKQKAAEAERLARVKEALAPDDVARIIRQARELEERQNRKPDASLLPKVELSDVPADIPWPTPKRSRISALPVTFYAQGTNGLSYQQLVLDLPALTPQQTALLPYYTSCLPEVGIGQRSYLDIQGLQAGVSGGINAYTSMRSKVGDEQAVIAYMVISSKALYRKQQELAHLLSDTLHGCRFDELARIKELMEQILSRREQGITSQGHSLAMGAACARMSPLSLLSHQSTGLEGLLQLKQLVKGLEKPARLQAFAEELRDVHSAVSKGRQQYLLVAEGSEEERLQQALAGVWSNSAGSSATSEFSLPPVRERVQEAWLTSTQVNFCSLAFPTVASGHDDSAALTVLAGFLRNGFLHRAIREQGGAYGGGASQDSGAAAFRFYSYRDPRLADTLDDYRRAVDWMLTADHDYAQLEESILGVISSLDKPASPAGSAKQAFHNELFGRTKEERAQFRARVLEVSIEELKAVTQRYLTGDNASIGIVSNKGQSAVLEKLGVQIRTL
jgi:Zn-dependent M16 (insulinase) family peptidase